MNEKKKKNYNWKYCKNNKLKDYLIVGFLSRVILSFMKINNNYIPNLDIIKERGLFSKNYHSSILIFESCIENINKLIDIEIEEK